MSTVQLKGKVIQFGGIEKSNESITLIGDDKERLTITFSKEPRMEEIFTNLGVAIGQHLMSNNDTAFAVCEYLKGAGYDKNIVSFSNGEDTKTIENGELPKVMYRYKNKFGIVQSIEQGINLDEIEDDTSNEINIKTNSGTITIKLLTAIKNVDIANFVSVLLSLSIINAHTHNAPLDLDSILNELEGKFLLKYTVTEE